MLATKNQQLNSIFERIVRDKNGVLVRVRFTIVEINGAFQGQIISATPLAHEVREETILLPIEKVSKVIIEKDLVYFDKIVSPYFSLDFFMSQPTRAPAFVN